jgi:hypothetical protein
MDPITTDEELDRAIAECDGLTARDDLDEAETAKLDALTDAIEAYESARWPEDDMTLEEAQAIAREWREEEADLAALRKAREEAGTVPWEQVMRDLGLMERAGTRPSGREHKTYEDLTPEHRAKIDAFRARRATPEARAEEERVRRLIEEEFPPLKPKREP